jgi:hypothetical protein
MSRTLTGRTAKPSRKANPVRQGRRPKPSDSRGHLGGTRSTKGRVVRYEIPLRRIPAGQRGVCMVELRGFEPLTFSLRA